MSLPAFHLETACVCMCLRQICWNSDAHLQKWGVEGREGDTCACVPWFLLKCSSAAASGASRWHCTAVCGTGLWAAHPVSVCPGVPVWIHRCVPRGIWMPPSSLMRNHLCYFCFLQPFFFCLGTSLASICSSAIVNTLLGWNVQSEWQWVSAVCLPFGNNAWLDSRLCNTQLYGNWQTH